MCHCGKNRALKYIFPESPIIIQKPNICVNWKERYAGIPSYFLEFDVTTPVGPFATRVEAFLETLEMEDDLF